MNVWKKKLKNINYITVLFLLLSLATVTVERDTFLTDVSKQNNFYS